MKKKIKISPDTPGLFKETTIDNENNQKIVKNYEYDENGNKISTTETTYNNEGQELSTKETKYYYKDDKQVGEIIVNNDGKEEYRFNKDGYSNKTNVTKEQYENLIKGNNGGAGGNYKEYDLVGNEYIVKTKDKESGPEKKIEYYNINNQSDTPYKTVEYELDKKGEIQTTTTTINSSNGHKYSKTTKGNDEYVSGTYDGADVVEDEYNKLVHHNDTITLNNKEKINKYEIKNNKFVENKVTNGVLTQTTTTSRNEGKLTEEKIIKYSDGKTITEEKITNYDKKDCYKQVTTTRYNYENTGSKLETKVKYSENNKKISESDSFYDENKTLTQKNEFYYDKNGDKTSQTQQSYIGGKIVDERNYTFETPGKKESQKLTNRTVYMNNGTRIDYNPDTKEYKSTSLNYEDYKFSSKTVDEIAKTGNMPTHINVADNTTKDVYTSFLSNCKEGDIITFGENQKINYCPSGSYELSIKTGEKAAYVVRDGKLVNINNESEYYYIDVLDEDYSINNYGKSTNTSYSHTYDSLQNARANYGNVNAEDEKNIASWTIYDAIKNNSSEQEIKPEWGINTNTTTVIEDDINVIHNGVTIGPGKLMEKDYIKTIMQEPEKTKFKFKFDGKVREFTYNNDIGAYTWQDSNKTTYIFDVKKREVYG